MRTLLSAVLASWLGATPPQSVYRWTDAQGGEHVTSDPGTIPKDARILSVHVGNAAAPGPSTAPVAKDPRPPGARTGPASPPPRPARPEPVPGQFPAGLRSTWRLAEAHLEGPPSGPAFVALAASSQDPQVVAIALFAVRTLYTPLRGGAVANHEGEPFRQVPTDESVFRLALARLDDPDAMVRAGAASVAYLGVAGPSANDRIIRALDARLRVETDPTVRDAILSALWSCHCGRRELADGALAFLERDDERSHLFALNELRRVGQKGRIFEHGTLVGLHLAADRFLQDPSPAVRAAAKVASKATRPGP